jgi:ANTAR domain/GAF domain
MRPAHAGISLADGMRRLEVPLHDIWLGVVGLGGDLSELEVEAYVLEVLAPDAHSHNLIAQALNEESLSAGGDHPVEYREIVKGVSTMTTSSTGTEVRPDPDGAPFDVLSDVDPQAWSALDRLSRALHVRGADLQQTLEAILRSACQVVPGADVAGLNLLVRGKFVPQAVFGEAPHQLDLIQQSTAVGPCIEASRDQETISSSELRTETRWPEFAARGIELGVQSLLCVPLWVDDTRLGSLSLYSTSSEAAFDDQARVLAELFATHAALALADAQRVTHLRQALVNRDVIGQAKGILMTRLGITADAAFARMSNASQALNIKLVKVAEAVSMTGELPTA